MKISQAFPSKYLKSEDLGDRTVRVVMDYVEICDVGDGENKPVLYFEGKEKGMVLNVTNATMLASIYGDETNEWHGQEVVIYVDKNVMYGTKRTGGLRVRPPEPRDVERDMRDVTPPVRQLATGTHGRQMPQRAAAAPVRDAVLDDVPF